MPQYLSTDPNAGEPIAEETVYLSTDPNAGEPASQERSTLDTALQYSGLTGLKKWAYGDEGGNLPMTLGGVGAVLGGVPGAAVGGAAGAATRDIIRAATGSEDVPTTATGAFGNVIGEAGLQAGLSKVPDVLKGGARRLYGGLLKPAKALKESFGGSRAIVEPLLQKAIPLTQHGEKRIGQAVSASRGKAMEMVRSAEAAGAPGVEGREIVSQFRPAIETLRKRADIGQRSELPEVGRRGRQIMQRSGGRHVGIPLTRAQALKEEAQDAASGAYRMRERGVAKQLSADDLLDEATAKGYKTAIESRAPEVGMQNRETQRLLGPLRAVEDAVERERNNLMVGGGRDWAMLGAGGVGTMAGGPAGGAASALIMRALATPSASSHAAIAMYQAGRLPLDQLIRVLTIEGQRETP